MSIKNGRVINVILIYLYDERERDLCFFMLYFILVDVKFIFLELLWFLKFKLNLLIMILLIIEFNFFFY